MCMLLRYIYIPVIEALYGHFLYLTRESLEFISTVHGKHGIKKNYTLRFYIYIIVLLSEKITNNVCFICN